MLFQSVEFLVFAGFVLAAYFALPHTRRRWLLLIASYAFYMAWDYRFSALMLASTLIDYTACLRIERSGRTVERRSWLVASLAANLGLLGVFKYLDFFIGSFGDLLSAVGVDAGLRAVGLILPVGISFYTFQSMSQTIDVYRGEIRAERDLLSFAVYVAFFPQLVAGPIVRARDFLPQLRRRVGWSWVRARAGFERFLLGLTKKVVIADNLGSFADLVYNDPGSFDTPMTWLGTLCFAGQIYADFSAYSDMAIGIARVFGFRFPENFDAPYTARSPSEFWRRWHISLSTWLRDYLYISLGGNRGGAWKTYRNLALTMLLGGLWHGASYNFIIWGAFHGALLIAQRLTEPITRPLSATAPRLAGVLGWAFMLLAAVVAWVPFRAATLDDTLTVLDAMFVHLSADFDLATLRSVDLPLIWILLGALAVEQAVIRFTKDTRLRVLGSPAARGLAFGLAGFAAMHFRYDGEVPFVYFQF
ncbi:MAG: MBOAT family O-acyltransferase [Planctomycetota bacterium]